MNKTWIIVLLVILLLIPTQSIHAQTVQDSNLTVEQFVDTKRFPAVRAERPGRGAAWSTASAFEY